jgi:hypothetical protein
VLSGEHSAHVCTRLSSSEEGRIPPARLGPTDAARPHRPLGPCTLGMLCSPSHCCQVPFRASGSEALMMASRGLPAYGEPTLVRLIQVRPLDRVHCGCTRALHSHWLGRHSEASHGLRQARTGAQVHRDHAQRLTGVCRRISTLRSFSNITLK